MLRPPIFLRLLQKKLRFLLNNKVQRNSGAKHCSSLCSQSEGGEYWAAQPRAENPTKSCPKALDIFATCSWPSLCEQSELQCWRRNRRLCGPVQISAARALPLTFDISILNTLGNGAFPNRLHAESVSPFRLHDVLQTGGSVGISRAGIRVGQNFEEILVADEL